MSEPVAAIERHTARFPCPVCGGQASLQRGRGTRCAGFTSGDSAFCTREQHAGLLTLAAETSPPAFRHRRCGLCGCGSEHAPARQNGRVHDAASVRGPRRESIPLAERDAIYQALLDSLELRESAQFDLRRRGLTRAAIDGVGYRSMPRSLRDSQAVLEALVQRFGADRLRACPGFTDKNGRLSLRWGDAYLVPYRDELGRITGLQFRELAGGYFTARGSVQGGIYHVGGRERLGGDLYITEGGIKSQVAAQLGSCAVMGVIGLSLTQEHVQAVGRMQPQRVIVAVDSEANPASAAARTRWATALFRAGFTVAIAIWEGSDANGPKGLDDLFQAGLRPRLRAFVAPPVGLDARRMPRETAVRGPISPGATLLEARTITRNNIRRFLVNLRGSRGRALLVCSGAGVGKSHAVAAALPPHARARMVTGTLLLAAELAEAHGYRLVTGRSERNCERIGVVRALEEGGHDIARLACGTVVHPRCPVRMVCPYWEQFERPGPLVAATEQAFNPSYVRGASVVIFDDADLLRGMVEQHLVTPAAVERAVELLTVGKRKEIRRLLTIVQHAFIDRPETVVIGPAVWDHLARVAAQQGEDLVALIDALPAKLKLPDPAGGADGYVSVQTVQMVPAGTLLRLLEVLREERAAFATHEDFNSRLKLSRQGVTVSRVRQHPRTREGDLVIKDAPILVLDATPIPSLVDVLLAHHERLPDVQADVRLPINVRVVQYTGTGNGYTALKDPRALTPILAEIAAERKRVPVAHPHQEGAIVYKDVKRALLEQGGFATGQVLTFGSARGTNVLAQVARLHLVGRPMPPTQEIAYLAQVIHHDSPPVSEQLALVPRRYGGQTYEIDVLDFTDARPAELLRAQRDDELLQDLHRARPANLEPQLELERGAGSPRISAHLIVHTSHAIPGLRVDELHVTAPRTTVNQDRQADADQRIEEAVSALGAEGQPLNIAAIARRAGASRNTVRDYFVETDHTLKRNLLKGVISLHKIEEGERSGSPAPPALRARSTAPDTAAGDLVGLIRASMSEPLLGPDVRVPCRGGCGTLVPPGQKCTPCVNTSVDAWVRKTKRRGGWNGEAG